MVAAAELLLNKTHPQARAYDNTNGRELHNYVFAIDSICSVRLGEFTRMRALRGFFCSLSPRVSHALSMRACALAGEEYAHREVGISGTRVSRVFFQNGSISLMRSLAFGI